LCRGLQKDKQINYPSYLPKKNENPSNKKVERRKIGVTNELMRENDNVPSEDIGLRKTAMNVADQYIQSGFESAMIRQATAEKMDDMPTRYDAGVFFTR